MIATTVDSTDTLAVLKAAEEWLSDPAHWTTRALWRRSDGSVLAADTYEAAQVPAEACAQTCASGALCLVTRGEWPTGAGYALDRALRAYGGIVPANDKAGYDAVMKGYRRAIETLEAESEATS